MNIKFIVNDYLIAWNILFNKSITGQMKEAKQRLWNTYKREYNDIYKDRDLIIKYEKDFIPDNDIIYNILFEKEDFKLLRKEAEKVRMNTIKVWDKNKRVIDYLFNRLVKKEIGKYTCLCINKEFDEEEVITLDDGGRIVVGKIYRDDNQFLIDTMFEIINNEIKIKEKDTTGIKNVIIEMAVLNEFATKLYGNSCYNIGREDLSYLKEQIYPYWLMYLGVKKDAMIEYMMRDKIEFDVNKYAYEKELVKMNLEEFIDFIIRNKRYIVKVNKLKIDDDYDDEII